MLLTITWFQYKNQRKNFHEHSLLLNENKEEEINLIAKLYEICVRQICFHNENKLI